MSQQSYNTQAARIGKIKGAMLAHAVPKLTLGTTGKQHNMAKNNSDTVVFRRWLPVGASTGSAASINTWSVTAADHQTSEGVTPDADTITAQDITVTLNEYSVLYKYTNKTADLYEDDVPAGMKKQAGERMGLVGEMIMYGALKGCTNKFYAGGTSRSTVDETISLNLLRKISRSLLGNRGSMITTILDASPKYNTKPIEASFLVYCHTDMEHDIRNLPNFTPTAEYGNRKVIHDCELGSCDRYRFIVSPELSPITGAGAAVGSTGLLATGGNIDIYPVIVVADDAWGDVALRGASSFNLIHLPPSKKDKSDPVGQRGYIGGSFWKASFIQNDGWMAVLEAGASDI